MTPISKVVLVFAQCLLCVSVVQGMCATQCNGVPDGTYPDCRSCENYVKCFKDKTTTVFCMEGTVFDVKISACNYPEQSTCGNEPVTSPVTSPSTTESIVIKPGQCVSSCTNLPDGDYQSCQSCNMYVSCTNGEMNDNRPCAATLKWDDVAKMCLWTSTTCI